MQQEMYPLLFRPVFKERVWGGRKLGRFFPSMPEGNIGEAWLLSGHAEGPTAVNNGLHTGTALPTLTERFGEALLGAQSRMQAGAPFPLLFKLLDAREDLSVQLHPGDDFSDLSPGERGKTEMWFVLDAEPDARVVYGLKKGVGAEALAAAIAAGKTLECLRTIEVKNGDVIYIPAGTIHALGHGMLVAEIQQSSDTTYRLYDYDRPDKDGKQRPLHIQQALRAASYGPPPKLRSPGPAPRNRWREICRSPYFVVAEGRCDGTWEQVVRAETFRVILLLDGSGFISWAGQSEALEPGVVCLVPAGLGAYQLSGEFHALQTTLP